MTSTISCLRCFIKKPVTMRYFVKRLIDMMQVKLAQPDFYAILLMQCL
jgi:hypothetical protein